MTQRGDSYWSEVLKQMRQNVFQCINKLALDANTYESAMITDAKAGYVAVDTYRWVQLGVRVVGIEASGENEDGRH